MSEAQLRTRIRKITKPAKMRSFVQVRGVAQQWRQALLPLPAARCVHCWC